MALRAPFLTRRSPPPAHRPLRHFSPGSHTPAPPLLAKSFKRLLNPPKLGADPRLSTHAWMRQDGPPCLCEYPSALPVLVHKRCDEQREAPAWVNNPKSRGADSAATCVVPTGFEPVSPP